MCLIVFCDNGFYGNVFTKANKHIGRQNVRKVNSLLVNEPWSPFFPFSLLLFASAAVAPWTTERINAIFPKKKKNSRKFTVVLTTCSPDLSSVYFLVFVLFCSKPTSFLLSRKMASKIWTSRESFSSIFFNFISPIHMITRWLFHILTSFFISVFVNIL